MEIEFLLKEMQTRVPGHKNYYMTMTVATYDGTPYEDYYLSIDDKTSFTGTFENVMNWISEQENAEYKSSQYRKKHEILFRKF